jgi:penicillin-binding protein 1C
MSPDLPAAAVAAEDQRFYAHQGLDLAAIGRALVQNFRAGRTVSGASTITQQVARMILADEARDEGLPPPPRNLRQKLAEAHLALRLERSFSKRDLLEAWLNRVPVGGVGLGVATGAERYFGRTPATLSLAQAALLVGLPRGPSALRPDRDPVAAMERRRRVLLSMVQTDFISPERMADAGSEPLLVDDARTQPLRARLGAWVAGELERRGVPIAGSIVTTIDAKLEGRIRDALKSHIAPLQVRGVKSGAIVVIDHRTDELLALVGSVDETDPRWGQVHAAFALRQPGSALKPFVYLAALEDGRSLASLAADVGLRGSRAGRATAHGSAQTCRPPASAGWPC